MNGGDTGTWTDRRSRPITDPGASFYAAAASTSRHAVRGPRPRGTRGQECVGRKEGTAKEFIRFFQMKTCPNNGGNLTVAVQPSMEA